MSDYEATEFDDELLSAYLDDELAPEERARVEERLAAEPRARQLLDELRAVSRTVQELPPATLEADLREPVLRRAERAMLVPGEPAAADGLSGVVRRIPFGRSKRAWLWAGAALAAGLLLMVFQREPGQDRSLPGEVAMHDRDAVALEAPLPTLEMRSMDKAKDEPVDAVAATPTAPPPAAVSKSVGVAVRGDASGGVGGEVAAADASSAAPMEDLLVVHVNVKPEAFKNRAFDAVLVSNQIEVEKQTADEATNAESSDVDLVLVEAAPAQVYGCLAELEADHDQYLGISIDEGFSANQRSQSAQRSVEALKRYNRGGYRPQQKVELGPNNVFYYQTNRGRVEIDGTLSDKSGGAQRMLSDRASGVVDQGRASRFAPQALARGYAASRDSALTPGAAATSGERPAATAPAESFYSGVKQNMARRAVQKLATKADMLQVLFVLEADEEPVAAKSTSSPAASPPAEEGLKIDER